MLPACGNVVGGVDGLRLNHSSTTSRQRRPATAGRDRTQRNWAIEDLTARSKTAAQRMLTRNGPGTLVFWLADHGRRGGVLAGGHRGLRSRGPRTAGDGYQGHGWHGRHNTGVRNLPDYRAERGARSSPWRDLYDPPGCGARRRIECGMLEATAVSLHA